MFIKKGWMAAAVALSWLGLVLHDVERVPGSLDLTPDGSSVR